MNIYDIVENHPVTPEQSNAKLEAMFLAQEALEMRYREIEKRMGGSANLNSYEGQARLRETAWNIVQELGEAMNELRNKPWKQTPMETDIAKFYKEISDFLHFCLKLFIEAGLDPITLTQIYFMKHQENIQRQETNY